MTDSIKLAQELISFKSVSGEVDAGALKFVGDFLERHGFTCEYHEFESDDSYKVNNLYAFASTATATHHSKNLCFAGHTDVVPEGESEKWSVAPYSPEIVDGYLIGRGAVDMKSSIASFMVAAVEAMEVLSDQGKDGTISFLITGDEEADAINGTVKLLDEIQKDGHKINACIVGEPTNPEKLGEMVKVGRRGSISFNLKVTGKQGHVAYPKNALNPNSILIKILNEIDDHVFDDGNEFFDATNLEITTIDVDNPTSNLIPESASVRLNIRFNNFQNEEGLVEVINSICEKYSDNFELTHRCSAKPFLCDPQKLASIASEVIEKHTDIKPELSTTGGTSDARFIHEYVDELIEFGLINKTAHQIDEKVKAEYITQLKDIYKDIIISYFD